MKKNNVIRLLDSHGIHYTSYNLPERKIGGQELSEILNIPPAQIFKTIVLVRKERGKPILALVSADSEVNLKMVARALKVKKVHMATEREAERITGLKAGGISPFALLNRGFQVIIDSSVFNHTAINVSGGQLGLNIRLNPFDFQKLISAQVGEITSE